MPKILLVEDDTDILKTNAKMLTYEGFKVLEATTAAAAFETVISENPGLIVLDIMLPDGDGVELCGRIRNISTAPILFLTCLDETADKVKGLMAGGDDYLAKPYDMEEFCARVRALLRRIHRSDAGMLNYPPLSIDLNAHRVYLNGEDVTLTPKEYQMLVMLAKSIGQPVDKELLYERLWAMPPADGIHTVHVHISAIRKKLKITDESRVQIKTIRNQGYCFVFSPYSS